MEEKYTIVLAGNPNVGKSTVFNALTGMKQHTGNWSGKTVSGAYGTFQHDAAEFTLADIPGIYSLRANSAEEREAADMISFSGADAVVVVCDATCLERNLSLVLQTMECAERVMVCVNLMDEAEKKGIKVDIAKLSDSLGVPVTAASARSGQGLDELKEAIYSLVTDIPTEHKLTVFPDDIRSALAGFSTSQGGDVENLPAREMILRMLCGDESYIRKAEEGGLLSSSAANRLISAISQDTAHIRDEVIAAEIRRSAEIAAEAVSFGKCSPYSRDRKLDRIFLSRKTGIPAMLLLLGITLWITVIGANYPSDLLGKALFGLGGIMSEGLLKTGAPPWLEGVLIQGIYKVLAWVVSVMLPPMAIFFPMFTLLEDLGYLPRMAFLMDPCFRCANACGKQAITMAMGMGCNACGVTGCRIIDSPRERLIAVLTNNFVPCNGRFPTIIAVITMFFAVGRGAPNSVISALLLLAAILLGVTVTLLVSKLLSVTLLKGEASSFTLELPSYRRPQIGKVLIRSVLDRTVFVLGRACTAAAPCGLLIWLMANIHVNGGTLLSSAAAILDPAGQLMGLDGVILLGFILGFPANEIVMPIIMMTYLAQGSLTELSDISQLHALLSGHGWTVSTAVCMVIFTLFHFPCATTCMTVKKETGSLKWTALSFLLPTATGILLCTAVNGILSVLS